MGNSEKIATRSTLPMYRASHEPKLQAYPVTPRALCTFNVPLQRTEPFTYEKIWDHASGSLLVEECGVSLRTRGVNLSTLALGEVMGRIMVFIAASKDVHGQVLAGVQQALAEVGRR
ncbi:hypothetical protein L210DRAFT_3570410 [Boletus edulis BED1]|uniref:Uncharacterized protein n=1 Tax=Boletus edulis BED1 TaxID=1328754 RepID=A0AAD4BEV3_BOLED|nr:hypothetical protein L210DRAFT_3570410 [Boletus edulis BED1]